MTRPTKDEVDAVLDVMDNADDVGLAESILTLEVRALREENASMFRNYDVASAAHDAAEARIVELRAERDEALARRDAHLAEREKELLVNDRLRATIARVEALLPQTWLTGSPHGDLCAAILAALRGGP